MENKPVNKQTESLEIVKNSGPSERFMHAVVKKFAEHNGEVKMTDYQKRLMQSYFIKIDQVLKTAEAKRMAKSEQYRDSLSYTWENVDMIELSINVVALSSVGLDPTQKNHLHPIPYKNSALNKYSITFTKGYNGLELVAKKFGIEVPDDTLIRVVYSNEKFTQIYKDLENKVESFIHKPSENPFDRGEILGGYYYQVFNDNPEKNKLRVFSLKDIQKRIPKTASVEFWGGEKDSYKNGKKEGKETVEGWFDEMVWKTLKRAAWDSINIDSQKIDEKIQKTLLEENQVPEETTDDFVNNEIKQNANKESLDFEKTSTEIPFEEVSNINVNAEVVNAENQPKLGF